MSADPIPRRRHGRALLVAAVAFAMLAAATPASAQKFRFRGMGWGHGIGLSQYGALGLAQRGWSAERILRWYYSGAKVVKREPPKPAVRVGLLQNRKSISISVTKGTAELRLQSGAVIETVGKGTTRTITVTPGETYVVKKGDGQQVGGVWGGPADAIEVAISGVVHVKEWGHGAGRGRLAFPTAGASNGHLTAILGAEEYLYGLGEVPSSWPKATLEAQAIAGRTYLYRTVTAGRSGCACDILGDTRDQAYVGWDKESGTDGNRWVAAVDRTPRGVAVYKGDLITTYYSSSSGGYTENIENVWTSAAPAPYLRGRCDPGDYVSSNPNRFWSAAFTAQALASKLGNPDGMTRATKLQVLDRGVSGRVVRLTIHGKRGDGSATSVTMDGWDLRGTLGLKETRFWVNQNRNVVGAIRARYDHIICRPGLATSNQKKLRGGRWQKFQRGRMYLAPAGGQARWLKGPVLKRYLQLKGPKGKLGWPTSDTKRLKGKRLRASFQRGVITCTRNARCYVRRH